MAPVSGGMSQAASEHFVLRVDVQETGEMDVFCCNANVMVELVGFDVQGVQMGSW